MPSQTMRIMCRRNCVKYIFTLIMMCVLVSLYIVALRHNRNVHKRFHARRLKVKRDVHSPYHSQIHGRQRSTNMTRAKEPPHADVSHENKALKWGNKKERLHVYIVDEHHEVIPYWFAAAGRKLIPKSGNTLVHIDGHADLAPPLYVQGFPFFIWPRDKELKFLMQTNDAFIQSSAIVGLVNRLIWVWPSWDQNDHEARYVMSTLSLGWMSVANPGEPTKRAFCMCMKNETRTECRTLTKADDGKNGTTNRSSEDGGFHVPRNQCRIKKIIIVEEIHEEVAFNYFRKHDWIAENENIILDIDEDYFGCSYGITPLLKANLSYKKIYSIHNTIKSQFCPSSSTHERHSDRFLVELIRVAREKRACYKFKSLKGTEKCQTAMEIDLRQHFGRQLNISVLNETIRLCSPKINNRFVNTLILKLSELDIKQLRALQKVGFCLNTSLKTFRNIQKHEFGICIGANTPKQTAVSEHTPTKSEIATRSILLKGLLEKLDNFPVNIVTISRSMRDGYTPREFFDQIEGGILNALNATMSRNLSLHYDNDLLGGKLGWPARHGA